MNALLKTSLLVTFVALLGACAGHTDSELDGVNEYDPAANNSAGATTSGTSNTGVYGTQVNPWDGVSTATADLRDKRVVYFDFDDSTLTQEARDIVAAHADYLVKNPNASVSLEGHTDERGTREYNMALGQQRADAVRRFMLLQGVSASQVKAFSYGEESPAAYGQGESSWSLNRRVEIRY